MAVVLAIVIGLVALAVSLWLAYTALGQVRQLRSELDQTQGHLNDTRQSLSETRGDLAQLQQELSELKAAAEVIPPPPPPLPRARSSGLEDLREQLRAAHREEDESSSDE
jgi:septal ring factor EnvC (AmiA/AmiB activator)